MFTYTGTVPVLVKKLKKGKNTEGYPIVPGYTGTPFWMILRHRTIKGGAIFDTANTQALLNPILHCYGHIWITILCLQKYAKIIL